MNSLRICIVYSSTMIWHTLQYSRLALPVCTTLLYNILSIPTCRQHERHVMHTVLSDDFCWVDWPDRQTPQAHPQLPADKMRLTCVPEC